MLNNGHRPAVIVSDEYEYASTVALIERIAPGQWRLIWHSVYTGC